MLSQRRGTVLLAIGAAAGVVVAASGVVERRDANAMRVPDDAVATVNGEPIRRVDYQRALAAFASDRRDGRLDAELRRAVLDRLIDEELLVQRGLELRLAARDPMVRRNLSAAVIALLVARAEDDAADPDEAVLRAFYRDNRSLFRSPELVRVQQAFFGNRESGGSSAAAERAKAARARLDRGESFAAVMADADETTYELPNSLIPLDKLREYVGPTATRAVAGLEPGQHTEPLAGISGHSILRLVALRPGSARSFESVRALVREEYRRNAGDARVRKVLADRREMAEIRVAEEKL
jgi:hypothetical protein